MIRITIETDDPDFDYASMLADQMADEMCGNWCMRGKLTDCRGKVSTFDIPEDGVADGQAFEIVVKALT